jgi:hypothetical protein
VQIAVYGGAGADESAVEAEPNRIKAKSPYAPDTEIGKKSKSEMDLPTVVVNKKSPGGGKEILRKTPPPKGKN